MGRRVGAWLLALAVAGGLGVGAVLVARSSGSGEPPVLELAAGGSQPETATAQARDLARAPGSAWPKVRYQLAKDLPDLPDDARAWRLAPTVTEARVAELARALGFKSRPTATKSGWRVFESGKLLEVSREFGARWTYAANVRLNCAGIGPGQPDSAVGSDDVVDCPAPTPIAPGTPVKPGVPIVPPRPCPPGTACAEPRGGSGQEPATSGSERPATGTDPAGGVSGAGPSGAGSTGTATTVPPSAGQGVDVDDLCRLMPVRPGCQPPPRPADLPSRQEAERIARDWFARAGVELDGRTVRVVEQWSRWVVTASPQVEGRPTIGFAAEVWVGVKGQVAHASGWLSEPEAGASYPLIGVEAAVDRLQQRRAVFARALTPDIPERYDPRCANLKGGCKDVVKRITDVRLGLQHTAVLAAGGKAGTDAWLVPAYLFEINGQPDQIESVIAIADRYLKVPQPQPLPAPAQPAPKPVPSTPKPAPGTGPAGGGTPGGG